MILLYRILISISYPLLIILTYTRKFFGKEDNIRFKEKIFISNFNIERKANSKLIWFHAASIGEFNSILPIIHELDKNNSGLEFLITTITLSSSNLAKQEFKNMKNVHHRFFPFDVKFLMKKFLSKWKPSRIFLVDSEIWPNLILTAKEKNIPIALINARITKKTFNKWNIFNNSAKKIFSTFDLCLVSNKETEIFLKKLQSKNISYNGNIKLISNFDESKITNLNKNFLLTRRFWVAASTHQGEDIFCLKVHEKIKEKYKDIVTIIAPRHINKAKKIANRSKNLNFKTQLLEKDDVILDDVEVVIINSFGVLQNYFKYAKSVFIGKSTIKTLSDVGGQNPIDAAKLGCKIYHGPYIYNFNEIYELLKKKDIAHLVETCDELSINLINDLKSPLKNQVEISEQFKKLSKKTLDDTMYKINNFIK